MVCCTFHRFVHHFQQKPELDLDEELKPEVDFDEEPMPADCGWVEEGIKAAGGVVVGCLVGNVGRGVEVAE